MGTCRFNAQRQRCAIYVGVLGVVFVIVSLVVAAATTAITPMPAVVAAEIPTRILVIAIDTMQMIINMSTIVIIVVEVAQGWKIAAADSADKLFFDLTAFKQGTAVCR